MEKNQSLRVTILRGVTRINDDPEKTITTITSKASFDLPFKTIEEESEIYFKQSGMIEGNHSHTWGEVIRVKPRSDVERVPKKPVLWLVWRVGMAKTLDVDIFVGDTIIIEPGTPHAFKVVNDPKTFFLNVLTDRAFYESGVTLCDPPLIGI